MTLRAALRLSAASLMLFGACSPPAQSVDQSVSDEAAASSLTAQLAGGAAEGIADDIAEDIDDLVAATVEAEGPGVAVLVMVDNQVFYAEGHGLSDLDTGMPITPDTVFDLASVSKQMTAIALLKLVESGDVDLDAPVADYLGEFATFPSDEPVLVRHLLHHTSGIDDYTGESWDGSEADFANLDLEAHLAWVLDQEPWEEPGEGFEYNNSGYALLALIVQRVSGQAFHDYMQTAVFQPLGMESTLVYSYLGQEIAQQAQGYVVESRRGAEAVSFPSVIAGDGNVFSSLNDLARYDQALRQQQLVSAATLDLAFTSGRLANGRVIDDDGAGYGMGWEVAEAYVHHSGSWVGSSTYYRHYTDTDLSVVVLSNDEAYDTFGLGEEISQLFELR